MPFRLTSPRLWSAAFGLVAVLGVGFAAAEEPATKPDLEERVRALEKALAERKGEKAKAEEPAPKKPPEEPKAADAKEYVVGSDPSLKPRWRDGLGFVVDSPHDDYHLHFGGRFDVDAAWFAAGQALQSGRGGVGPLEDGAELRRARLRADGQVYEVFDFVVEIDVAQGVEGTASLAGPTDVYADATHLPVVGNVRVGHFREPFGMDALTSGNALTFLERSNVWEAFVPFRNVGVLLFDTAFDDRVSWAVGAFRSNSRNTGNAFDYGDGEYALTGRVTAVPWYEQDGRYLFHVGAAASRRSYSLDPGQDAVRYRVFPGTRVGRYVFGDTGNLRAEAATLLGAEVAFQVGPVALQAEYTWAKVEGAVVGGQQRAPTFAGGYVQVSYFLTGEHKRYRRRVGQQTIGVFDRPTPHENFFLVRGGEAPSWGDVLFGRGAWEVAARLTHVDLSDRAEGVPGQVVRDVTFGINWHLNSNMKVQVNAVLLDRRDVATGNRGAAQVAAIRVHYDF